MYIYMYMYLYDSLLFKVKVSFLLHLFWASKVNVRK